jgi:hypothetical protein
MVKKRVIKRSLGQPLIASTLIRDIEEMHLFGRNIDKERELSRLDYNPPITETDHVHYYKIKTTFGLSIRIKLCESAKQFWGALEVRTNFPQTPRSWKDKLKRIGWNKHSWYDLLESDRPPWFEPKGGQVDPRLEARRYSKIANMWNLPFPSMKDPRIQSYDCWIKTIRRPNGFGKHKRFRIEIPQMKYMKDDVGTWSDFMKLVPFGDALLAACDSLNMRRPSPTSNNDGEGENSFRRKGEGSPGRNIIGILTWTNAYTISHTENNRLDFFYPEGSQGNNLG